MRERGPDGLGAGSDKSVSIQGGFRWQNPGDLWVYITTDEVYSEVEAKLTQTVTKSISCLTFVHRLVSLNYIRGSEHAAGSCEAVDFSLTTALLFVRGYSSVFVPLLTNVMSVPQREREREKSEGNENEKRRCSCLARLQPPWHQRGHLIRTELCGALCEQTSAKRRNVLLISFLISGHETHLRPNSHCLYFEYVSQTQKWKLMVTLSKDERADTASISTLSAEF